MEARRNPRPRGGGGLVDFFFLAMAAESIMSESDESESESTNPCGCKKSILSSALLKLESKEICPTDLDRRRGIRVLRLLLSSSTGG